MLRIGVLASHEGTTLQSIIDGCAQGRIDGEVVTVISNNSGSGALRRAAAAGIETIHLSSVTHSAADSLVSGDGRLLAEMSRLLSRSAWVLALLATCAGLEPPLHATQLTPSTVPHWRYVREILLPQISSLEPRPVRLTTRDGGVVRADLYGSGTRGLVLAHGGRFTKASWAKQVPELLGAGFRVLAIDFRGFGESPADVAGDPAHHLDVLAATHYLRKEGATTVAVIGASFGGAAAAAAAVEEPGAIDRLVLLGATPDPPDEKLVTRKLYIATRDDANAAGLRLPGLQAHFAKAPEPKELLVLPGSAHAQFMFDGDLAPRVMREILRFLTAP